MMAPGCLHISHGCFTSTTLSNIRRVGLSVGVPGRTRGPNHISGLRFKFWDSNVPVYVGQWFHEVDSLSLAPGERIAGFTFLQTQESDPNSELRNNIGRITGVKICKTGLEHKEVEISFGRKDDMLEYSFVENLYEELDGLAWSFEHQCDYIYVLTRPPKSRPGSVLKLHDMDDESRSSVPCKLFWQVEDDDENWLHVSSIHAFFNDDNLSGFIFEYGNGQVHRQAGSVEGDTASMILEDGERITHMDVLTWKWDRDEIIFHTNKNRVCNLRTGPPYEAHTSLRKYIFGELHGATEPDTPSLRGSLATQLEGGEERCVGIWVTMQIFPRALGIVERVGPILQ
ncbi:hypothetical protein ACHAPT_006475 [Fusarium lateritium]